MEARGLLPNGKLIKNLRLKKDMTQEDLATAMGKRSKRTVENIEKGKRASMNMLRDVANALDVEDPESLIVSEDSSDSVADTVVVLQLDSRRFPSLAAALSEIEPVLKRLARGVKVIRIEFGSIILTVAMDEQSASGLLSPGRLRQLSQIGVLRVTVYFGKRIQSAWTHRPRRTSRRRTAVASHRLAGGDIAASEAYKIIHGRARMVALQVALSSNVENINEIVDRVWAKITSRSPFIFDRDMQVLHLESERSDQLAGENVDEKFRKWVSVAASEAARSLGRKRRKRHDEIIPTERLSSVMGYPGDTGEALEGAEIYETIGSRIGDRLGRMAQEIYVLRVRDGNTYTEIQRLLDISAGTVAREMRRIREVVSEVVKENEI